MSNRVCRLFHSSIRKYWYAAIGVILAVIILVLVAVYFATKLPPLTTVFQKDNNYFRVSSNATSGPMFQEGYLIPFFPSAGDTQTMSLIVSDVSPVTSVTVTEVMDTQTVVHPLRIAEGDAKHGLWKGSWEVSDTHDNVYNIIMRATDKESSSSVQITEQ
ncbi:MAG: hypothetical protein WCF77_02300 [Minisyncoccia bacterium]